MAVNGRVCSAGEILVKSLPAQVAGVPQPECVCGGGGEFPPSVKWLEHHNDTRSDPTVL